jgi:hypothetical protein
MNHIVVDALDPARLARFWAGLLGGEPVARAMGWSHVDPPGFMRIAFQPVPEEKVVKNRLHLDVEVKSIAATVARAEGLGASRMGGLVTDESGSFQVMVDPEGNEFCFVHG